MNQAHTHTHLLNNKLTTATYSKNFFFSGVHNSSDREKIIVLWCNMQLMTFNSLLMFDIVFVFFLFLVGVTCLVYYLPPSQHAIANYSRHSCKFIVEDEPDVNARNVKSSTDAAAATPFEYQIEADSGCAQNNQNAHTWNHRQHHHQHQNQHQHQHHHHEHWQRCENMDQTKFQYPMLKCNTNRNVHSNDDINSHDVDIQLNMTNEKCDSRGLPMQRTHTEFPNPPSFCYIKAKYREIKHITGPIQSV